MHRLLLYALRLLCLLCRGLVSVGACCCEAVLPLPRASWSLRAPSLSTTLFWTLHCRLEHLHQSLLLLGHTIDPLRVVVQSALSTSSAASGRCSRISPSRGLVESLVAPLSCFFRAALSLPSLDCDCTPFVEASLPRECLAHFAWSPGRRRLDVSSRPRGTGSLSPLMMLGLCCCSDVTSPWVLSFALSMANSALNSAQFVCHSRRHHSSCLFMNCLFDQLDTVGVSARPSCQCSSLAKIMRPTSLKSALVSIACTLRQ